MYKKYKKKKSNGIRKRGTKNICIAPLQCSCLGNPRDRGVWRVAVSGVAQSRTRLKWLSSSSSSIIGNVQSKVWFERTYSKILQMRLYHMILILNKSMLCYAKSLQSCPTLCDLIDNSPPGFPVPGILQARTLEWVAISFSNAWEWKEKVKSFSRVQLLPTPWTAAYQAPLSMGFSRQEYWSGVPLPSLNKSVRY